jgi:hypothetical protein
MQPNQVTGMKNVLPTLAKRNVSHSSKSHLSGFHVFGDGAGRIVGAESHLEFNVALCLDAHHNTADLHEQVPFDWLDELGRRRTHYFDFVVTTLSGDRVAYSVKPLAKCKGRFADDMQAIAEQATQSRDYAQVRIFTDQDLDPVMLFNAKLLHACRTPVAYPDAKAREVLESLTGVVTIAELVSQIGLLGDGFRAVVRLLRGKKLRLHRHEHISYTATVYKSGTF